MSRLKQACFQGLIFVIWVIISFLFIDFSIGLMYCSAFIVDISGKKYVHLTTLLAISLFVDIYSFAFVGATFIPVVIARVLARRFKLIFRSFLSGVGYFLLSLSFCKFVAFALVSLIGRHFHMLSHFMQIIWSLFIYAIYNFSQALEEVVDSHA